MRPIIRAEGVGKLYQLGEREGYETFRDAIVRAAGAPFRLFRSAMGAGAKEDAERSLWALRDVGFEIAPGEVVGIIGRNGAGKSTLLKILSRITEPTTGQIDLYGRIGSLLEVGTGFHPELTGRENVYLNGGILGMRKAEIDRKFDEIVEFAEVAKFIDTPVKRYSSGMHVRLFFAVAAHLDPEILVVDEVLAVGDVRFQKKCMEKMSEVGKQGRTVLFVSHNMAAITRLCPRSIFLSEGTIVEDGPSSRVVGSYLHSGLGTTAARQWDHTERAPGDDVVRLRGVRVIDREKSTTEVIELSDPVGIEVTYDILQADRVIVPHCRITNDEGIELFQTDDWDPIPKQRGRYVSTVWIPANFLSEGTFYVRIGLSTPSPTVKRAVIPDAVAFQTVDDGKSSMRAMWGGYHPGVVRPVLDWTTTQAGALPADHPSDAPDSVLVGLAD